MITMADGKPGIDRRAQFDLFGGAPGEPAGSVRYGLASERRFVAPDPREIYLGQTRLDVHLREQGLTTPLSVSELLDGQDWRAFEARYAPHGRAPYAPRCMMGLILYGIMQGVTSLRSLEKLARADLGCMWVSGGITPDHAIIGRFITLHDAQLSGAFFEQLTASVLAATGTDSTRLAGDGTVVEAACSRYRLLQQEAARQQAEAAHRDADAHPTDPKRRQVADRAEAVAATADERAGAKAAQGKFSGHLRVSSIEPEAMLQPLKRGRGKAPAYRPSVLANEGRIIVALDAHPSSETAQVAGLLAQSERVIGAAPQELLLDAGYCTDAVIEQTLERDISLLCPQGRHPGQPRQSDRYFPKDRFVYRADADCYICPAGERLTPIRRYRGNDRAPGYVQYATDACGPCALRRQCTRSAKGRWIKRYAGDEAKDALRGVMEHPQAQRIFRGRQAMVEPVFSVLRSIQGLDRFRRRGRAGVRREFALHALAYNLARAVALNALMRRLMGRLYALPCAWLSDALYRLAPSRRAAPSAQAQLMAA
jgi:transposase